MEVSVVIPTHNRANTVVKAVNSVLKQTYKDFSIIVVSDGSSDDTELVMKKIEEEENKVNFFSYEVPKGGNYARNLGIEFSESEYIAFLDDDDEWSPDKLKKQMEIIKNDKEIGLVYTGSKLIYQKENLSYFSLPKEKGDLSKKILFKNYIGTTSSVVIKKSLLNDCGSFDTELEAKQDYDLWIRICQKTKIGIVTDACVNYYNDIGNNQISQQTDKYIRAMDYIEKKYINLFSKLSEKETKIRRSNFCLQIATLAIRNNNSKLARSYCRRAIRHKFNVKSIIYILLTLFEYKKILKIRSLMKF
ncbi:glycosyltransferase family A protein [Marinococcus sp. PL1-022]|uniref:glycosyltransferase family 2 protein n=1 Tax=Marinococcus sp. PL1-022 TaxID=3095363 RepID=UPI0029C37348|nr:glycosyltransferase family A protein [Marinococcus sp. PL1-022]MDX6153991.1 glycosyltransferase family A protein [Marinococcus sp. PL1-022]